MLISCDGILSEVSRDSLVSIPNIPHEDDDPVMRLYAHYFLPADLMHRQYTKLREERRKKGRLSNNKSLDLFHFQRLWLATLFVVADGFSDEIIKRALAPWRKENLDISVFCGSINHQMGQKGDKLTKYRNATFHYQPNAAKHLVFIRDEGLQHPLHWAEDLHREFGLLFSEYRVSRTVQYIVQQEAETS